MDDAAHRLTPLLHDPEGQQLLVEVGYLSRELEAAAKAGRLPELIASLPLPEEQKEILSELVEKHKSKLESKWKDSVNYEKLPVLKSFQWRAEMTIASRHLPTMMVPSYTLCFETEEGKSHVMTCDAGVIKKLGEECGKAAAFNKSITYRKLKRGLN